MVFRRAETWSVRNEPSKRTKHGAGSPLRAQGEYTPKNSIAGASVTCALVEMSPRAGGAELAAAPAAGTGTAALALAVRSPWLSKLLNVTMQGVSRTLTGN